MGQRMIGKPGQGIWTFGNSHYNDFFVPKTGVMDGTHFALLNSHGKLLIRDFSSILDNLSCLMKLPKDVKVPIA